MTVPAVPGVSLAEPTAFDRCKFHPGCCEPEDMTCTGCGAIADRVFIFERPGYEPQRIPVCSSHEHHIQDGLEQIGEQITELRARLN